MDDASDTTEADLFFAWLKENGIRCPKCGITTFSGTGRGVVASDNIRREEIVVEVPDRIVLWEHTSSISNELLTGGLCHGGGQMLEFLGLVVALVYEKSLRAASRWAPYLDFLPKHFEHMPTFWGRQTMHLLKGTSVYGKLHAELSIDKSITFKIPEPPTQVGFWYQKVVKPFVRRNKHLEFPEEQEMRDLYSWAVAVVASYSFVLGEEEYLGIVPMWDMLNHVTGRTNVRLNHCARQGTLQMIATKDLDMGSEVINSYGKLSNSQLLQRYGYVEAAPNPYDCASVSIWEILEDNKALLPVTGATGIHNRISFLRKYGLFPQGGWFKVFPHKSPPVNLTECLRVLTISNTRFQSLQREVYSWRIPKRRPMCHSTPADFAVDLGMVLLAFMRNKTRELRQQLQDAERSDNTADSIIRMITVVIQSELDACVSCKNWLEGNLHKLQHHPRKAWKLAEISGT